MGTITVNKNIPDDLYQLLKMRAAINRRSLNSEIIACIERSAHSRKIDSEEVLADARRIRKFTSHHQITDAEINQIKDGGRL